MLVSKMESSLHAQNTELICLNASSRLYPILIRSVCTIPCYCVICAFCRIRDDIEYSHVDFRREHRGRRKLILPFYAQKVTLHWSTLSFIYFIYSNEIY